MPKNNHDQAPARPASHRNGGRDQIGMGGRHRRNPHVGREAEKYGVFSKGVFSCDHLLKTMNEDGKTEVIILCVADYKNRQLKAQWISHDEDLIESFYLEKGQKVMTLENFKKYQMKYYAQRKAEEIEASAVVAGKIAEFADRFPFTVDTAAMEEAQPG